jgi:hypothetical protein
VADLKLKQTHTRNGGMIRLGVRSLKKKPVLTVVPLCLCLCLWVHYVTYAESKHSGNDVCSDENFGSRFGIQVNASFGNGAQTNDNYMGETRKRLKFGCLPAENEEHKRHARIETSLSFKNNTDTIWVATGLSVHW